MSNPRLILASTSRYRRSLMDRLRLDYEAIAPPFEEAPIAGLGALETVQRFAIGKAESIEVGNAVIIGSDQGMIADGELLGKPGTADRAQAQLLRLAGGRHQLVTAVAVRDTRSGETLLETEIHSLAFRSLSPAEAARYVELDEPLDCAGSFKIESLGVTLFDAIEGSDPTGIIGLPLIRLTRLLRQVGISPLAQGPSSPPTA